MITGDTIVALATGWAPSPRALVRLSGPHVPNLLQACFDPSLATADRPTFQPARLRLSSAGPLARSVGDPRISAARLPQPLLPVLLAHFPAARSYTGEHALELLIPGKPALIERVIAAFTRIPDVRHASPGEFSARAFLNARLTLAQAEGVAATIAARTDDELQAARRVYQGDVGRAHSHRVDELATLLALVEAGIDFTDQEDVVPISPRDLDARLHRLASDLRAEVGAAHGAEHPPHEPAVVLVGEPNAGKSTLFNALLGRARSVVSPFAGTTRDVIAEPLDLSDLVPGLVVRLIDIAGLDFPVAYRPLSAGAGDHSPRPHAQSIDAGAQHAARIAIAGAAVLLHCDPAGSFRLPLPAPDSAVVIRVRTKGDLPALPPVSASTAPAIDLAPGADAPLCVCALDGRNLAPLRRAIADGAWRDADSSAATMLPRHRRAMLDALDAVDAAHRSLSAQPHARSIASPELIAGSLRVALDALTQLTGRVSPDDVVGRIFATFCIGK
ncbi:MAG: tRNA modification GTPase [Phycisphaerales bacterium]